MRPEILVVDDRVDIAQSVVAVAESYGLGVISAHDLPQARLALTTHEASLLLTIVDKVWERDKTAGLEFVSSAKRDFKGIKHVLMTAWPIDDISESERMRIKNEDIDFVSKVDLDLTSFLPPDRLAQHPQMHVVVNSTDRSMYMNE